MSIILRPTPEYPLDPHTFMFIAKRAFPRVSFLESRTHARAAKCAGGYIGRAIKLVTSLTTLDITIKELTGETITHIEGNLILNLFEFTINKHNDNIFSIIAAVTVLAVQTGRLPAGVKKMLIDYADGRCYL